MAYIASYLRSIADEATGRGYAFDSTRIVASGDSLDPIDETEGQLRYEWEHLGLKLQRRSPAWYQAHVADAQPTSHPLFRIVAGEVRDWERIIGRARARAGA